MYKDRVECETLRLSNSRFAQFLEHFAINVYYIWWFIAEQHNM